MAQLTRNVAQQAYEMNKAAIESVMKMTDRFGYHIIIGNSKGEIIFEFSVNVSKWKADYKFIATGKFNATVRTGLSMSFMMKYMKNLLMFWDPEFIGSWKDGDIIVAISGLPQQWDEARSKSVAADANALLFAA